MQRPFDSRSDALSSDRVDVETVFPGGGETGALMRRLDWSKTELGPVETWSRVLRTLVGTVLNSPFPMLLAWGEHHVQLYNDGYRDILEGRHPGAMGRRVSETWSEIWPQLRPIYETLMREGRPLNFEKLPLLLTRKGFVEETYFTLSYSPIPDSDGGRAGVLLSCFGNTGQVLGERRLRTIHLLSRDSFRARTVWEAGQLAVEALASNPKDLPFVLLYLQQGDGAPPALVASSGMRAGGPPGERPSGCSADAWPWREALQTRRFLEAAEIPLSLLEALSRREATPSDRAMVLPVEGLAHEPLAGFLVVGLSAQLALDAPYREFLALVSGHLSTALTNARAYEEEKRRADQLAELNRAKTAFFSNVSHEFRTPLTLMLGPTEDALASPERALRGEELERVHRNELRLLKLVNMLLDFSRIEADRTRVRFEPTDLATLTAELASAFDSVVATAGMRLFVECPPLPEPVWVDRDMWEKVVLNLVSNAFKFTFAGEIAVRLEWLGDWVALSVQDTGTGIAEEELLRIFDRFHRVEGARGRSYEGSGIGLALVRELVKLHGGRVSVASTPGRGSTFTVFLPTGNAHLPREYVRSEPRRVSTAMGSRAFVHEARQWISPLPDAARDTSFQAPARVAPRGHVLFADDNADMRDYMGRLLKSRFTVEAVADGWAALAAARARPPDVVLSDVMMPGLDGFGLLRELREDPRTAHVPVVLVSARAGEESTVEGLEAGADDYLVKPFGARELLARVEGTVKAAQARAERERLLREIEAAHHRLRGLFENAPALVCTLWGPQHVFEMANPFYRRIVGVARKLIGLPVKDALQELAKQGFIQLLDGVYRTGKPFIGREVFARVDRHGDGRMEEAFFTFVYQPRRNAHGEVEGIDVFGFEVTDQVLARHRVEVLAEKLRTSQERLRELVEASGAGTVEVELATGLITADERLRELFFFDARAPFFLADALSHIHPADRERASAAIKAAFAGEKEGRYLEEYRTVSPRDGRVRWVEARARTTFGADGQATRLVGTAVDITARKEAEAAREDLLKALGESEIRYRYATRATKDAIWDWNMGTNGVTWNEGVRELFGYAVEEVPSDATWWFELLHPDDRERVRHGIYAVIDAPEGHDWHDEYQFRRRDGTYAFVAGRGWVARDTSGKAVRMVGAIQDCSERKAAEAAQARQSRHNALSAAVGLALTRGVSIREMLQECVDAIVGQLGAAFTGIWLLGPQGNVLELQASAGTSPPLDDAHGRVPVCPYDMGLIAKEMKPHLSHPVVGDPRVGNQEWAQREGLVAFAGYPLLVGDRLVGVLAMFARQTLPRDTLETLKQVADSIALGVERLRAESELRTRADFEQQLIGIVSHDLRNPLGAILLGATLLTRCEGLDAHAIKSVMRIQASAERAIHLVKDLLDFTQVRLGGGIRIEPRPADLHEVTRGVLDEVESAYPHREVKVMCVGDGRGEWDADRLAQVVQNLVTNALKYSPEESLVQVATRAEEGWVSLSVSNRGAPIPPEALPRIFEPLQRATAEVDKMGRSVGLGLFIVKRIVDAHGGTITVESTVVEGTTFTVRLPRKRM